MEIWYDSGGNGKFKKDAFANKIDGLVALAMSFGMQYATKEETKPISWTPTFVESLNFRI